MTDTSRSASYSENIVQVMDEFTSLLVDYDWEIVGMLPRQSQTRFYREVHKMQQALGEILEVARRLNIRYTSVNGSNHESRDDARNRSPVNRRY